MNTFVIYRYSTRGHRTVRLVIEGVPDHITPRDVLEWLDDRESGDYATLIGAMPAGKDVPRVRWRGRSGRPEVGAPIYIRLTEELLALVDADAKEHGESRAAAIRRLLSEALR